MHDPHDFHGQGELILLVDDDERLRVALARMLQALRFSVVTAADGDEAFEIIKRSHVRIDAVLLDVFMPHLGGPELVDRLECRGMRPPVVLMSGCENTALPPDLRESGRTVLRKPFTPEQVLCALRDVLHRPGDVLPPLCDS